MGRDSLQPTTKNQTEKSKIISKSSRLEKSNSNYRSNSSDLKNSKEKQCTQKLSIPAKNVSAGKKPRESDDLVKEGNIASEKRKRIPNSKYPDSVLKSSSDKTNGKSDIPQQSIVTKESSKVNKINLKEKEVDDVSAELPNKRQRVPNKKYGVNIVNTESPSKDENRKLELSSKKELVKEKKPFGGNTILRTKSEEQKEDVKGADLTSKRIRIPNRKYEVTTDDKEKENSSELKNRKLSSSSDKEVTKLEKKPVNPAIHRTNSVDEKEDVNRI